MAYCTECGSEVSDEDKFCSECGSPVEMSSTEDTTHETRTTTEQEGNPSIWGAFAILGLWILFFMTFPGMEGDESMRAFAGFVVLISLPIIWYDAREAKRAGQLEVGRPIFVVLAILLLWIFTVPAYAGYRLYKTYK